MATVTQPRVGIYLRISKDPYGTQTATERQEEDCRRWCERNGLTVSDVFEDVDTSAFSRKTRRPQFERMIEAVRAGQLDGVVGWKADRLVRQMRDLVRLDEACREAGAWMVTVVEGIDTRTPMGRTISEIFVSIAGMESENISLRSRRRNEHMARQGKPHAGGGRPFGYTGGVERHIVPEEAALVRELVERVIAGESLVQVARDWSQRHVLTPRGNAWTSRTLGLLIRNPTITGKRRYGDYVAPEAGWEAIVSEEEQAQAVTMIERRTSPRAPRTKHLLTGLLRCGRCGAGMIGGPRTYHCVPRTVSLSGGCGGVARRRVVVEDAVRDIWLEAVASPTLTARITAATSSKSHAGIDQLMVIVHRDEESLARLAVDHYSDGRITAGEYYAARDAIASRIEATRRQIAAATPDPALNRILDTGPDTIRSLWDDSTIDARRSLLAAVIDHITVAPAGSGHRFNLSQLTPVWRY